VPGFQYSSKVDLNANFFVSIIRNQEFSCLLRRGVAGCITGLLLRDAESSKGLPDPWMIIDRRNKFPFHVLKDIPKLRKIRPRQDPVTIIVFPPIAIPFVIKKGLTSSWLIPLERGNGDSSSVGWSGRAGQI